MCRELTFLHVLLWTQDSTKTLCFLSSRFPMRGYLDYDTCLRKIYSIVSNLREEQNINPIIILKLLNYQLSLFLSNISTNKWQHQHNRKIFQSKKFISKDKNLLTLMLFQQLFNGVKLIWVRGKQKFFYSKALLFSDLSTATVFNKDLIMLPAKSLSHRTADFYALNLCQPTFICQILPIFFIKFRTNQKVQIANFLILSHKCSSES